MGWMAEETREEIFDLFPQLRVEIDGYGPAARTSLKAYEAKALKSSANGHINDEKGRPCAGPFLLRRRDAPAIAGKLSFSQVIRCFMRGER